MPRIFDTDNNALDFCNKCFPTEEETKQVYGDAGSQSYNETHPDYDDCDYDCEKCGKPLTAKDN